MTNGEDSVQRAEWQLICLLHGPGGSGKSTVINLVKSYAKEYCDLIGHPFTVRTIVTTAMSGVAATLLNGETAHSALAMNRAVQQEDQDEFQDTRLIIIDEISFAGKCDFEVIDEKLRKLMKRRYTRNTVEYILCLQVTIPSWNHQAAIWFTRVHHARSIKDI